MEKYRLRYKTLYNIQCLQTKLGTMVWDAIMGRGYQMVKTNKNKQKKHKTKKQKNKKKIKK